MEEDIKESFKRIEIIVDNEVSEFNKTLIEGNLNQIKRYIENLIKGYKELEALNKMQEYRISVIDERELIPKSKVREKIEEANKEIKQMEQDDIGVGFTLGKRWSDLKAKVKGWEELLQEGDK